jgi:hypothetical protein
VEGALVKLDVSKLTLGDWEDLEDYSPEAVKALQGKRDDGHMPAKAIIGVAWMALRQENPDATVDDVRKMTLDDIQLEVGDSEDEDPTNATG